MNFISFKKSGNTFIFNHIMNLLFVITIIPLGRTNSCITKKDIGLNWYNCYGLKLALNVPKVCTEKQCGLIVDTHGGAMDPDMQNKNTQMRERGENHSFIVMQPRGSGTPPLMFWPSKDFEKVHNMTMDVIDVWNVDTKRIHACGFSAGGYVTWYQFRNYTDLYASIAIMSATGASLFKTFTDVPITQIPLLHFSGWKDVPEPHAVAVKTRNLITQTWGMDNGTITHNTSDYNWWIYRNQQGNTYEFVEFTYFDDCDLYPLLGHCFVGSSDTCHSGKLPGQLYNFACPNNGSAAFSEPEEVMKFFLSHPKP